MIQSGNKKVLHYNFFKKFQGRLNVSGNYTGIYRHFPWQVFEDEEIPLIKRTFGIHLRKYRYVVDFIDEWEKSFNEDLSHYNYSILDIFYWENNAANWVSMWLNELDIAIEEWNPINNREILVTLLSVDPTIRINDDLATKLVKYLWEDTLLEPLEKVGIRHPIRNRSIGIIINFIKKIGLWDILKRYNNRKNII